MKKIVFIVLIVALSALAGAYVQRERDEAGRNKFTHLTPEQGRAILPFRGAGRVADGVYRPVLGPDDLTLGFKKDSETENARFAPVAYIKSGKTRFLGFQDDPAVMDAVRANGLDTGYFWAAAADLNRDGDDDILLMRRNLFDQYEQLEDKADKKEVERWKSNGYPLQKQSQAVLLISDSGAYKVSDSFAAIGVQCQEEQPLLADFDNDGWLDIFMSCYSHKPPTHNYLIRNKGQGVFEDVTDGSGVAMPNTPQPFRVEGAQAADLNGDGLLDFYVGSHLFLNEGHMKFRDAAEELGLKVFFDEGMKIGDLNRDGLLDIAVLQPYVGPRLFLATGQGGFREAPELIPLMGSKDEAYFQYDQNGDGFFDFGYVGLNLLDLNYDGYQDIISGKYDARRTVAGQRTPILLGGRSGYTLLLQSWIDDHSADAVANAPSIADVNGDEIPDLARYIIIYGEKMGAEKKHSAQLYLATGGPVERLVKVTVLSAEGYRNQQGRALRLTSPDGSYSAAGLVDSGSGFLNHNEYDVRFFVPSEGAYRVSVEFAGRVVEADVQAGSHLIIREDGTFEAKAF